MSTDVKLNRKNLQQNEGLDNSIAGTHRVRFKRLLTPAEASEYLGIQTTKPYGSGTTKVYYPELNFQAAGRAMILKT